MVCTKCNNTLPDDSVFCQFCGNKITIEDNKTVDSSCVTSSKQSFELDFSNMNSEEIISKIMQQHADETIETMKSNIESQPYNENDTDFGLVPEKPIFTYALKSVEGQEEFLNKLYTLNGEKINYKRQGSISVPEINGMVDVYNIYLPSGQLYKTIYINMYGAYDSSKAPNGFTFTKPKEHHNTAKSNSIPKTIQTNLLNKSYQKLFSISKPVAIILTIISMIIIIIALNAQDIDRNYLENWNTTAAYFVLLAILGAFLFLEISKFSILNFKLFSILSPLPSVTALIFLAEGSLFSEGYFDSGYFGVYRCYDNFETVTILNTLWFIFIILLSITLIIPSFTVLFNRTSNNWHKSITYKEKCYKKIDKMHSYYDKGIISQEEFETVKKDILKKIK